MDAILAEISQFNATEKEKRTGLKRKSSTTKQSDTTVIKLDSKVNNVCHSSSGLPDKSVLADKWTFATDYNDHFETPQIAYLDIYNILYDVAMKLDKCIEDLVIYDPYYCDGSMKSLLTGMGFKNVINENRDFYSDISRGLVPEYDVMVTNPPYSADHKVKLLDYLSSSTPSMSATVAFPIDPSLNTAGDKQHSRDQQTKEDQLGKRKSESKGRSTHNNRPFLLLLPIYISTKSYWREFVAENKRADGSMDPYYIVPPDSYSYLHPEGTGKDKSPFFSCWFLGLFGRMRDIKVNQCLKRQCLLKVSAAVGAISVPRNVTAYTSPEQLIARGYVSEKRANPKQRRKTKGLLGTVAVTAVSTPPGPNKLLSSDKSKKHIDKNMDPSNNSDAVHIKKKKKRY